MLTMDVFSSHTMGEQFRVMTAASCKSSSVIYLITCGRCSQHYVGETGQPLHCRINGHCYNIMHGRTEDSPVADHFINDGYLQTDMIVMVIDEVQSRDPCLQIKTGKKMDQDSGDVVPFWNEPQGT